MDGDRSPPLSPGPAAVPPRWYRRLAAIRVPVECGGATHHLLFKRGCLVVEDHDLAAEAVMVALGGEPPACVEVRSRWRELCTATLPVAELRGRGPATVRRRFPSPRPAGCELVPDRLVDVLMCAWSVRSARECGSARFVAVPDVVASTLQHRVSEALRRALGPARKLGARSRCKAAVAALPPGHDPQVDISVGPGSVFVRLRLGVTWLAECPEGSDGALGPLLVLGRRGAALLGIRWDAHGRRLWPSVVEVTQERRDGAWQARTQRPARSGGFWSIRSTP